MSESRAVKRFALLPAGPAAASAPTAPKIRHYRLARVRLDDRMPGERFAHLKHPHD